MDNGNRTKYIYIQLARFFTIMLSAYSAHCTVHTVHGAKMGRIFVVVFFVFHIYFIVPYLLSALQPTNTQT